MAVKNQVKNVVKFLPEPLPPAPDPIEAAFIIEFGGLKFSASSLVMKPETQSGELKIRF